MKSSAFREANHGKLAKRITASSRSKLVPEGLMPQASTTKRASVVDAAGARRVRIAQRRFESNLRIEFINVIIGQIYAIPGGPTHYFNP